MTDEIRVGSCITSLQQLQSLVSSLSMHSVHLGYILHFSVIMEYTSSW